MPNLLNYLARPYVFAVIAGGALFAVLFATIHGNHYEMLSGSIVFSSPMILLAFGCTNIFAILTIGMAVMSQPGDVKRGSGGGFKNSSWMFPSRNQFLQMSHDRVLVAVSIRTEKRHIRVSR